jgi:hypothetical protein
MTGLRNVRWHEVQQGLMSFLAPGTVVLGYEFMVINPIVHSALA